MSNSNIPDFYIASWSGKMPFTNFITPASNKEELESIVDGFNANDEDTERDVDGYLHGYVVSSNSLEDVKVYLNKKVKFCYVCSEDEILSYLLILVSNLHQTYQKPNGKSKTYTEDILDITLKLVNDINLALVFNDNTTISKTISLSKEIKNKLRTTQVKYVKQKTNYHKL